MDMSNQCGNNDDGNNDAQKTKMIILGICGGIGSGKSTACQLMVESLGCAARIGEFSVVKSSCFCPAYFIRDVRIRVLCWC